MLANDPADYSGLPPPDWAPPSEAELRLNEGMAFAAHELRHCAIHPENAWWHVDNATSSIIRWLGHGAAAEIYDGRRLELLHAIKVASPVVIGCTPALARPFVGRCFASLSAIVANAKQNESGTEWERSSNLTYHLRWARHLQNAASIACDLEELARSVCESRDYAPSVAQLCGTKYKTALRY